MQFDKNLARNLEATRARFVGRVTEWIPAFDAAGSDWNDGPPRCEDLSRLRMQAHKIAGSARVFGFAGLSRLAAELEDELIHAMAKEQLNAAPKSLLCAVENFAVAARQMSTSFGADKPGHVNDTGPVSQGETPLGAIEPEQSACEDFQTRRPHILVVDDDDLMREAIIKGLSHTGWTFSEAVDGQDAIVSLFLTHGSTRDRRPDLILMDVDMPKMLGFEALKLLKRSPLWHATPIIMLTRRDADVDLIRGIAGGAQEYITKPFELGALSSMISETLEAAGRQVLVAVGDRDTRHELADRLGSLPVKVTCVNSAEDALEKMRNGRTRLVLIDDAFMELDGPSLADAMRTDAETRDIPVMTLHAEGNRHAMVESLRNGAIDSMIEPFDVHEMIMRITGILRRAGG